MSTQNEIFNGYSFFAVSKAAGEDTFYEHQAYVFAANNMNFSKEYQIVGFYAFCDRIHHYHM